MRRAVLFPGGGIPLRDMCVLAPEAEAAGFDTIYCVEAYRSGLVPLTAVAAVTSRIGVGTYVLNAHARPPVAAGMAARDLDELSQGRLVLGVGSGNPHINVHHLGIDDRSPLRTMTEYVTGLQAVVRGRPGDEVEFDYAGSHISWRPSVEPTRPAIPIYLAAMYPRMRRVAALEADGLALGSLHSAEYVKTVIEPAVDEALAERGRARSSFDIVLTVLTSVGTDAEQARRTARRALCRLFTPLPHPYYESILREHGWSEMVDGISAAMGAGDEAAAVDLVGDEVVDEVLVAGDLAQCEAALARYEGIVDEIVLVDATSIDSTLRSETETPDAVGAFRAVMQLRPTV